MPNKSKALSYKWPFALVSLVILAHAPSRISKIRVMPRSRLAIRKFFCNRK